MPGEGEEEKQQNTIVVLQEQASAVDTVGDALAVAGKEKEGLEHVAEMAQNDPDYVKVALTRWQFILVFLSLGLGIFIVSIDFTIISTAIPAIAKDFNNFDQISWIGSAFFLTATSFSPTYGSLCDIFGRKEVFISAVTIFEVGSLLCGIAPSLIVLIFGRAIQGIGLGGIISCTFILISDIVPLRDRGTYQGIIGGVYGMAGIVGPLIGGVLTDSLSWRWCFYINLPVGFITLAVIMTFLKFPAPEGSVWDKIHKVDYMGTFWVVAATSLLIVPLTNGGTQWAWSDPKTISLICLSIVCGIIFVLVEVYWAAHPLIPMSLFKNRSVYLLLAISWILAACYFSVCFYAPSFYQLVYGDSATMSGVKTIPLVFGAVALMIFSGVMYSTTGRYKNFLFAGSIFLTAGDICLSTMKADTSKVAEVFYLLIAGIGAGCIMQISLLGLQASVGAEHIAVATSTYNFFMNMGGCIALAVSQTIFNNELIKKLGSTLAEKINSDPSTIQTLTDNKQFVLDGVAASLGAVYYYTIPLAAMIFILTLFVEEYKSESKEAVVAMV